LSSHKRDAGPIAYIQWRTVSELVAMSDRLADFIAFLRDFGAATALEYGLIGAAMVGLVMVAFTVLGTALAEVYTTAGAAP